MVDLFASVWKEPTHSEILIIQFYYHRTIREKDISKSHIQLCSALLCMYMLTLILVVLSAKRFDTIYGGCVTLSLLVHYFTLAAVMWMGAEALLMFQKLVIVFVRITTKLSLWFVGVSEFLHFYY